MVSKFTVLHFFVLYRKSSQPPVMVSRNSQSTDSEATANLETVSMVFIPHYFPLFQHSGHLGYRKE